MWVPWLGDWCCDCLVRRGRGSPLLVRYSKEELGCPYVSSFKYPLRVEVGLYSPFRRVDEPSVATLAYRVSKGGHNISVDNDGRGHKGSELAALRGTTRGVWQGRIEGGEQRTGGDARKSVKAPVWHKVAGRKRRTVDARATPRLFPARRPRTTACLPRVRRGCLRSTCASSINIFPFPPLFPLIELAIGSYTTSASIGTVFASSSVQFGTHSSRDLAKTNASQSSLLVPAGVLCVPALACLVRYTGTEDPITAYKTSFRPLPPCRIPWIW